MSGLRRRSLVLLGGGEGGRVRPTRWLYLLDQTLSSTAESASFVE